MVSNCLKVELHLFGNLSLFCVDTTSVLVLNDVPLEGSSWQVDSLGDLELNLSNPKVLFGVVYCHDGVGNLIGIEYVLVKVDSQIRDSLLPEAAAISDTATATAAGQLSGMLECRVRHKLDWWLMNNQHLLVLQVLIRVCFKTGLDGVLYLSFGSIVVVLACPQE